MSWPWHLSACFAPLRGRVENEGRSDLASGVVIELPQPGANSTRPSIVEVETKATGTLVTETGTVHNGVSGPVDEGDWQCRVGSC